MWYNFQIGNNKSLDTERCSFLFLRTYPKFNMSNNHTLFYSSSPFIVKSRNDKFTIQLSIKNKKDSAYNTRALVQYSPNIIFAGIEVGILHVSHNLLLGRSEEFFVSRLHFTVLTPSQLIVTDSCTVLSLLIPLKECIYFDLTTA